MLTHYSGIFDNNEIDRIISLGEQAGLFDAMVLLKGKEVVHHPKRNTMISWIQPTEFTTWLFYKATKVFGSYPIETLQAFQYSVYEKGGHYKWHRDVDLKCEDVVGKRICSAVLQLSDPEDYRGGILKVDHELNKEIIEVEKEKGMISVFPANWKHTVTPVLEGTRKTLVMWGLK